MKVMKQNHSLELVRPVASEEDRLGKSTDGVVVRAYKGSDLIQDT